MKMVWMMGSLVALLAAAMAPASAQFDPRRRYPPLRSQPPVRLLVPRYNPDPRQVPFSPTYGQPFGGGVRGGFPGNPFQGNGRGGGFRPFDNGGGLRGGGIGGGGLGGFGGLTPRTTPRRGIPRGEGY